MRPSFTRSMLRIFDLALGEMIRARRTMFLALIAGAPLLLALIGRLVSAQGSAVLIVNGIRVGGSAIFNTMLWVLYLKFIVPAIGVLYGTSLIADEVEDRTITYLFTRPIRRSAVVAGKYLAYLLCATSIVLPSVTLVFLVASPFESLSATFVPLVLDLGILAVGLAAYGALFLAAGVVLKRPLVAGLVFVFGWEEIALVLPGYLKHLTLAYYLQSLAPPATVQDGVSLFEPLSRDPTSPITSLVWLLFVSAGALLVAARAIERREYTLES